MQRALVIDAVPTGQIHDFGSASPPDCTGHPTKGTWIWLPYAVMPDPAFDPATQVLTAPALSVSNGQVISATSARAMTPAELVALAQAQLAASDQRMGAYVEGLILAIVAKGGITLANLPAALQAEMTLRAALRAKIAGG